MACTTTCIVAEGTAGVSGHVDCGCEQTGRPPLRGILVSIPFGLLLWAGILKAVAIIAHHL